MKKRIVHSILWSLFGAGVLFLMSFVSGKRQNLELKDDKLHINIAHHGDNAFLNDDIIKQRVAIKLNYNLDSVPLSKVNLWALENTLSKMDEVKQVQVYKSIEGELVLDIKERVPVVRVIHQNGMSNYIDSEGKYMGLSSTYTARVPIVIGHVNESEYRSSVADMPKDTSLLFDNIHELGSFIYHDDFWNAQIQEIYINPKGEFELTPLVGEHRILFGNTENIERKFKKLKIFYEEGLNNTGWNEFDTINVKFKNQIVCS